ncbi:hypothetical protein [Bacillus sp. S/N-304-OC-R1]|nr:hypothetical protein [Bacillus sp. S/N-304-OC-R1]MBY0120945.1 hypothetical protein [Bacillus sp. S/N-304-OC-R1]
MREISEKNVSNVEFGMDFGDVNASKLYEAVNDDREKNNKKKPKCL